MRGRTRGRVRPAALFLSLCALAPAAAQVPSGDTIVTIPVGPVLVQPFLFSSVERTNNVFQRQGQNREAAGISTVTPGFLAQLPFSHSHAFVGYALRWREYNLESFSVSDQELPPDSHYLRGQVNLVFGTGWFFAVTDDFSHGVVDTQTFQGNEVRFSGEQMQTNHLIAEVGMDRGTRRRLKLVAQHIDDHVVGERNSGIFDTLENRAALEGEHQARPALWLLWGVEGRDNTRTRAEEEQLQEEARMRVGARWRAPGGKEVDGMVGVAQARFPQVGKHDNNVVGSFGIRFPFDRTGVIAARLGRDVYPSVVDDIYFVSNNLQLEIASNRDAPIGLGTSAAYYANTYPATTRGNDRQLAVETWIGYRLRRRIEARLTVTGSKRVSDTGEFDYQEQRVALQLRIGAS